MSKELVEMGIINNNIVEWTRNGIEYAYPATILAEIFMESPDHVYDKLQLKDDVISANGISRTKNELKNEVIARLVVDTKLPLELETKLLGPVQKAID